MAIINGLHGRARMRRAALSRAWLLALLVLVPIGIRALEADVFFFVRVATAGDSIDAAARWIYDLGVIVACAGYIVAGIAFDRFGLKRGFALAILAWCAVVPLVTIADPAAYRVLTSPLTAMLPGFVVTGYLLAARLAWPLRRRGVVVMGLLLLYGHLYSGPFHLWFARAHRDIPASWQFPVLVLTTLGVVLFVIWLVGLRDIDSPSGLELRPPPPQHDAWSSILMSKAIWTILAIELCQGVVWHLSQGLRWELGPLRQDASSANLVLIDWTPDATTLVAAWATDYIYRKGRGWIAARRPFILVGLLVAGFAPALGALAEQSGPALHLIDLAALGAVRVTSIAFLDIVPRRLAGRTIGFVVAGEAVGVNYLYPLTDQLTKAFHSVVPVITVFALVGAAIALRLLPRLHPAEP